MINKTENKGFTLVELLVVITIIGVLSAVVTINYSSAKKSARDSKRKADIENVSAALELYYSQIKGYPMCTGGATNSLVFLNQQYVNATSTLTNGYLSSAVQDPLNNANFKYGYYCADDDNNHKAEKYVVFAVLEKNDNNPTQSSTDPLSLMASGSSGTFDCFGTYECYGVVGK